MAIPPFKTLEGHDDDPFRAAADDDGGLDPFGLEARYGPSYFHFDDDDGALPLLFSCTHELTSRRVA